MFGTRRTSGFDFYLFSLLCVFQYVFFFSYLCFPILYLFCPLGPQLQSWKIFFCASFIEVKINVYFKGSFLFFAPWGMKTLTLRKLTHMSTVQNKKLVTLVPSHGAKL